MSDAATQPRSWRRPPLIGNAWLRWAIIAGALVYLVAALLTIEVNWERVSQGLTQGWRFIEGFLAPDFTSRSRDIWRGMEESLTMTVTSTIVGCLISRVLKPATCIGW